MMLVDGDFDALFTLAKIALVDVLLSGDNAVVIALACRGLPAAQARRALLAGTGAAIVLRVVLTALVTVLLQVPLLKLAGAVALLAIAVELSGADGDTDDEIDDGEAAQRLVAAVGMIVAADASMSLDNVVALAAVTHGNFLLLLLGLCLSIPLLIFGSVLVKTLMDRYPALVTVGGVLLGWVAGNLAASDPLVADWIDREAFMLAYATPLAGAIFVWVKSRTAAAERARAPVKPRRPARVPRPRPAQRPTPTAPEGVAPVPALATGPLVRGGRAAVFRYVLVGATAMILVYVVGALGTAFSIIGASTDHTRATTPASCAERVLAANRGTDAAILNRLVAQCRTQERANQ